MAAKDKKTSTTVYFPREEADFLFQASRLRGEQLFGRGQSGKLSAYVIKLIKKDLMDHGLLELDKENLALVPRPDKLVEIEAEIKRKQQESLM